MKQEFITAFIGIGSNLDNPTNQVKSAINKIALLSQTKLVSSSSLYQTPPLPPVIDQPDFINAVTAIETQLTADQLLAELQAIEQEHGRRRLKKWGPRTLDLDILLYGAQQINSAKLQIPHPELAKRNFVLYPLAEIAPHLKFPTGELITNLLSNHQPPKRVT